MVIIFQEYFKNNSQLFFLILFFFCQGFSMAIVATKTEEDVSTIVDRLDDVHQVFLDLCIFYDTISPIILTVLLFFFFM